MSSYNPLSKQNHPQMIELTLDLESILISLAQSKIIFFSLWSSIFPTYSSQISGNKYKNTNDNYFCAEVCCFRIRLCTSPWDMLKSDSRIGCEQWGFSVWTSRTGVLLQGKDQPYQTERRGSFCWKGRCSGVWGSAIWIMHPTSEGPNLSLSVLSPIRDLNWT